ncbi:hypothetical protein F5Y19DRAFT_378619 [Xylariaceae sp. FL1651]|nr:hypothetical protein F5Y19DRAFT_378619 [Xylariaceae sp. FL1651]
MLRRSHKKTKKGSKCEECRRRHIRCDQRRPGCVNCHNADRHCTYKDHTGTTGATKQPSSTRSPSSTSPHRADLTITSPPPVSGPSTYNRLAQGLGQRSNSPLVNMVHMELFSHFIQGTFLFIDKDLDIMIQLKKTALQSALTAPYLMHEILAFSARHLSTQVDPGRSQYYLNQSTELQTWALAHFEPAPPEPDQENCVALFLFSSLLGTHALADLPLLDIDPEQLFFRFGQYFSLHRGVKTISDETRYRSLLRESEIHPMLQWCESISLKKGRGSECDSVRQLVIQSNDLSLAATEACHLAIEHLQCVFDECSTHRPIPAHCVHETLAWPLLVSEKIVDLVILRRPVALIILAYYGVTLDFCRDLWIVGQTGKHIVRAVTKYLGPDWISWLHWPCEVVGIQIP